jgi:multiple RNA-binding domain-containing protein 1
MTELPSPTGAALTRVCIKNLPLNFDEAKLQQFLLKEAKSALMVTDIKVLRKSNGASRKVAFVGFQSSEQARHVVQHFHKAYCLTSRLTVEFAFVKDVPKGLLHPTRSAEYTALHNDGERAKRREQPSSETPHNNKVSEISVGQVDKRREEFLAAMGLGGKTKFWANDDGTGHGPDLSKEPDQLRHPITKSAIDVIKNTGSDDSSVSSAESDDSGGKGADALLSSKHNGTVAGSVLTDLEFLRSKATAKDKLDSESESSVDNNEELDVDERARNSALLMESKRPVQNAVEMPDKREEHKEKPEKIHGECDDDKRITHNRLFIRNLPFAAKEDDVKRHFSAFGQLIDCHLPIDDQKQNKGYAFVTFVSTEDSARALEALDGTDFQGRLLKILLARRNATDGALLDENDPSLSYKQKQDIIRRKQAMSSTGWSASYVRGDAVADNLAERLGLRKGELLNVKDSLKAGDAAVTLALGETHIIEENRAYFRQHGIDMEALISVRAGDDLKRSSTAILVKNLPFDTSQDELLKLFASVRDSPRRLLLSPSKTIALIEYGHSVDARMAFKKLAYKRYRHVPLYLEWAPLSASSTGAAYADNDAASAKNGLEESKLEDAVNDDGGVSFSIYVKNLNFVTSEDKLREVFEEHVPVRAVKIPVKAAPIKRARQSDVQDAKLVPMGYAFVECDSDQSVRAAIQALQGKVVDGHALELKRSSKQIVVKKAPTATGKNPTKLVCRNVPFQANRKELLQLFGSFGQLKKVRLPKKFDGNHRGFAFIEYLTGKEAQSAMNALSSTHLYGRHLVLEWATEEDDMDALREKAKRDSGGAAIHGATTKKAKMITTNPVATFRTN